LSGRNFYAGSTLVSVGPLVAGSTTAFSANSAFTVSSVLDLNGFSNNIGSLTGLGTMTNNGATAATLLVGGNGTSTLFGGTLTDGLSSFGLTKDGIGTLTLAGANDYSGSTVLNGGTLQADSVNAFSPNSSFIVDSRLDLNGNSNAIGSLSGSGSVTNIGGAAVILTAGGDGTSTVLTDLWPMALVRWD
jgi:autotransporter-associated beta strand protein